MRWGVRDESTDDHSTLELCLKELKACQDLSTGPNFMVNITTIHYAPIREVSSVVSEH